MPATVEQDSQRTRVRVDRIPWWSAALLAALVVAAVVARSTVESQNYRRGWSTSGTVLAALAIVAVGTVYGALTWRAMIARIGNRGLAFIALISAIHFAVSFASRIAGSLFQTVLGPYAVFIQGIGDEGVPCLLLAATVALLPERGVLALSLFTVFTMNVLVTGTLGLTAVVFIVASAVIHECIAAALGVTRNSGDDSSTLAEMADTRPLVWQTAAIAATVGLSNAASLAIQFAVWRVLYRMFLSDTYIAQVILVTGLVYGTAGGIIGARLGCRLQRTTA